MNNTHKPKSHIASISEKLQREVDDILVDIADYIIERSENGDAEASVHLDVDLILSSKRSPYRVARRPKAHIRGHRQSHIVNRHGILGDKHPMPQYDSEFVSEAVGYTERRPFGKLNTAARFMFGTM